MPGARHFHREWTQARLKGSTMPFYIHFFFSCGGAKGKKKVFLLLLNAEKVKRLFFSFKRKKRRSQGCCHCPLCLEAERLVRSGEDERGRREIKEEEEEEEEEEAKGKLRSLLLLSYDDDDQERRVITYSNKFILAGVARACPVYPAGIKHLN